MDLRGVEQRLGRLAPTDFQHGRIRRLRLRGRWLVPPGSPQGRFADGVRYAVGVDDETWIVIWRYGSDGGVLPSTRWYADVGAAARDGVPESALEAAGLTRVKPAGAPAARH